MQTRTVNLSLNVTTSRQLLGTGDFTLLGSYATDPLAGYYLGGGGELNFGQGFTHRYVGGQLRFLTHVTESMPVEIPEAVKTALAAVLEDAKKALTRKLNIAKAAVITSEAARTGKQFSGGLAINKG